MNFETKKTVKYSILILFFILIIAYAFFTSYDFLFGIKIKNVNLTDGTKTTEPIINITGNAKNAINLELNGRDISIDQKGNFNETIALLLGYNIINIKYPIKIFRLPEMGT